MSDLQDKLIILMYVLISIAITMLICGVIYSIYQSHQITVACIEQHNELACSILNK